MVVKRGVVKAFDSGTYKATVQVAGSSVWLVGVPVARDIAAAEMVAGRNCALIFFDDESNPNDAVLAAVYT